jgi:hypothetical protein
MKRVSETQFVSDFGFKSNNFTVDDEGNITATSITLSETAPGPGTLADFILTNDVSNNFLIQDVAGTNPTISLFKSRTYVFDLNLTTTGITFYREDQTTLYSINLIHSSGDRGAEAQAKRTGTLSITIPSTYTESTIYYSNDTASVFGTINVLDPIGSFSTVSINSTTDTTTLSNGALTVAGGVAIAKTLRVGDLISTTDIESNSTLTLKADLEIRLITGDSSVVGVIDSTGLSIPIKDSQINNTVIGSITPAVATFSTASVVNEPAGPNEVTKKSYVDLTSAAFAIALGS